MVDFNKKLKELDIIMKSINDNSDLDKKIELYEIGKKQCEKLENILNKKKKKIDAIDNSHSKNISNNISKDNKNILYLLNKIEELYHNINNENISFDKLEEYYQKAITIKEKSQQYYEDSKLNINLI